jgi:hypothetical protein
MAIVNRYISQKKLAGHSFHFSFLDEQSPAGVTIQRNLKKNTEKN